MDQSDELLLRELQGDLQRRQWHGKRERRLGDVVSQLLAKRGYSQTQNVNRYREAWQQAVGESWAASSRPGTLRRGVLDVYVDHSSLLQEMNFQKHDILQKLARLLPDQGIRDVRFRVGG